MTRLELLRALIRQAKQNGFSLRSWFESRLGTPWPGFLAATELLASERRYYALLFSHEFAKGFWKSGEKLSFIVQPQTFVYRDKHGETVTVTRKAHTRRTTRANSWQWHLKEMAITEEPLRYIRRFLVTSEDLAQPIFNLQHVPPPPPRAAVSQSASQTAP